MSLFFTHKTITMEPIEAVESSNPDGTKNKTVIVTAKTSNVPYVCVAVDSFGPGHFLTHQNASVYLTGNPTTSTSMSIMTQTTNFSIILEGENEKTNVIGKSTFYFHD